MKKDYFRKSAKICLRKEVKFRAKCEHYRVIKNLKILIKLYKSKRILIYIPMKFEPNVLLLRRDLAKDLDILVPFMESISLKMVNLRLPFYKSKFGVREPKNSKAYKKRIDLAIVPVVGVDGNLARVGHGKGYYDMFFNELGYRPKILFVGMKDMFIDDIVTFEHDVKCDIYLTPKKNYLRGRNDRDFNRLRSRCSGSWRRILSC
ncbi:MAG: 5-formyltetrahydrofolate cyclo-ligase [Campylobacter sp.]|nr:5-formyltetrahydrofolate cyclo-ligase [Campylobacter sp.]